MYDSKWVIYLFMYLYVPNKMEFLLFACNQFQRESERNKKHTIGIWSAVLSIIAIFDWKCSENCCLLIAHLDFIYTSSRKHCILILILVPAQTYRKLAEL